MARLRSEINNPPPPPGDKRKKPRVILYKNEDGSFDTSGLSDEEKQKIFGGASAPQPPPPPPPPQDTGPAPEPVPAEVVGMALNLLVSIEAAVVGQKLGIDQVRAYDALTPREPLATLITAQSTKVINKYGGSLGPWADEIALGCMIVTWQVTAFNELRRIAAEIHGMKQETPPPHPDANRHSSPPPEAPPAAPAAEPVKPADSSAMVLSSFGLGGGETC